MEQTVSTRELQCALELRVFDGPQAGARAQIATGIGCLLAAEPEGAGADADVVLREDQVAPARVRITTQTGTDVPHARLEVLQGEVRLRDQVLTAGALVPWAMYTPLQIGRSSIAFGPAGLAQWPQSHRSPIQADSASATSFAKASARKHPAPLFRRAEVWLAGMGAVVLLLCGAALSTARLSAAPHVDAAPAPTLAETLKASEFAALTAAASPDGRIEIEGRLGTQGERAKLDNWLAERQIAAIVNVHVDETVARDVTEVFRVNGVAVQAQVVGPGHIAAKAAEPDANRLARAEEVVWRDVRGLKELTVQNTAKPLPPPAPPIPDDPGKRIASLVPGEPGFLVTADGARYFVGAMLPSGHRITDIAKASVTLERDGQQSTLNF